jgi:hypothetical protein
MGPQMSATPVAPVALQVGLNGFAEGVAACAGSHP